MELNRNKLTNIIAEAMTNLHQGYVEETEPWHEIDGVESVNNELKDKNPLNNPSNNYYDNKGMNEMKKNTLKLTENELHNIIKSSITRIIKEMNGMDFDSTNIILDKLNSLGEECNSLGLYDMAEDINEIIQKYNRF